MRTHFRRPATEDEFAQDPRASVAPETEYGGVGPERTDPIEPATRSIEPATRPIEPATRPIERSDIPADRGATAPVASSAVPADSAAAGPVTETAAAPAARTAATPVSETGVGTTARPVTAPVAEPVAPVSRLAMPRSRGAMTGLTLLVLGVWGGIVPFIGPWFHYSFINQNAFSFPTYGRLWLEILPGALAAFAGLQLIGTNHRGSAASAGLLACIAGGWFVIGQSVSTLWYHGVSQAGVPLGGTFMRMIEELGYFYLLGAVIVFLGATAMGRMTYRTERDARYASRRAAAGTEPAVR
ncbi:MAG: hypothetical protein ACRDMX_06570 [Solirubrobacteraceae bacterium]